MRIKTLADFIRQSNLQSSSYEYYKTNNGLNSLKIKTPKHSNNSPAELILSEYNGGLLARYYGGRYNSTKDAIESCGVDPNSILFAIYGRVEADYLRRGAYNV